MVDRYHCGDICNEQNEHKSLLRWILLPRPLPAHEFFYIGLKATLMGFIL